MPCRAMQPPPPRRAGGRATIESSIHGPLLTAADRDRWSCSAGDGQPVPLSRSDAARQRSMGHHPPAAMGHGRAADIAGHCHIGQTLAVIDSLRRNLRESICMHATKARKEVTRQIIWRQKRERPCMEKRGKTILIVADHPPRRPPKPPCFFSVCVGPSCSYSSSLVG